MAKSSHRDRFTQQSHGAPASAAVGSRPLGWGGSSGDWLRQRRLRGRLLTHGDHRQRRRHDDSRLADARGRCAAKGRPLQQHLHQRITNWNPFSNYNEGYRLSGVHVYDRLMTARLTEQGYVLEAAAKVELSDPTTVVFTLKPGLVYQDKDPVNGRPVKASDIVAVQNYVKALTNAENSGFQKNILDSIRGAGRHDGHAHLTSPYAYLFASTQLCNPTGQLIVPEELIEDLDNAEPIGSGPYQYKSGTFNAEYLYERFEKYRGAAEQRDFCPTWTSGRSKASPTHAALETALRGGEYPGVAQHAINVAGRPPLQ